jgi:hypothetical protein
MQFRCLNIRQSQNVIVARVIFHETDLLALLRILA